MNKLIFISVGICLTLAGCATVGKMQAGCEATTTTFPEMAECLKVKVAGESRMKNNSEVKLYLLKADQLSERVKQGTISEIDARVELQQLFVQLKHQETTEGSAAAAAYNASKPKTTRCYPVGNTVQCNTY